MNSYQNRIHFTIRYQWEKGHGRIPAETLSDYGISTSTSVSILSVAWLISNMLLGEILILVVFILLLLGVFFFFFFFFCYTFLRGSCI